jgi:CRISPR-associated protein Csx17
MPELKLSGCTPEPLMSYLKALGVLRVIAEQEDPDARLSWAGGVARLKSRLDRDAIIDFFVNEYAPAPIVAPWGARSGFYPGSPETSARDALNAIVAAAEDLPRLAVLRDVIIAIRKLLRDHDYAEKAKDEDKLTLMQLCRNILPDSALPWLDAVFVLTDDSRKFPPILGTGGNEGSGSYVSTFAQIVVSLLVRHENDAGLATSLFGEFGSSIEGVAVGHFSPGALGGANSSQGFGGGGGANPWDYLLALEGSLLFAGAAARRYGTDNGPRAAFPFCVEAVPVGYGSESDKEAGESTRAELWLPLWSASISLAELSRFLAEGRAQLGRRQARNAVEFALALATLGVSSGADAFVRYAFVKRNGLSYFAAPLGRVDVRPLSLARLLDDPALASWVQNLRRACSDKEKTPARYQTALRQIDRATYEFATRAEKGNESKYLVGVLRALGRAERSLANGKAFCEEKHIHPLQGLGPRWLLGAAIPGDAGRELRLAASLASILGDKRGGVGPLRTHLEPVSQNGRWVSWDWSSTSAVWSNRSVVDNIAAVLMRRLLESEQASVSGCSLNARLFAPLADVIAFIDGRYDKAKFDELLWSMVGIDWGSSQFRREGFAKKLRKFYGLSSPEPAPIAFGLIRLTLTPQRLSSGARLLHGITERRWRIASADEAATLTTTASAPPFERLATGDLAGAENLAARRLWSDRLTPFGWQNRGRRSSKYQTGCAIDARTVLAACLFPLSAHSLSRLARHVLSPPSDET